MFCCSHCIFVFQYSVLLNHILIILKCICFSYDWLVDAVSVFFINILQSITEPVAITVIAKYIKMWFLPRILKLIFPSVIILMQWFDMNIKIKGKIKPLLSVISLLMMRFGPKSLGNSRRGYWLDSWYWGLFAIYCWLQDCCSSIALTMELLQSRTKPSIWYFSETHLGKSCSSTKSIYVFFFCFFFFVSFSG